MLIRFCSLSFSLSVSLYFVPFLLLLSFCRTSPSSLSMFFLSSTFPSLPFLLPFFLSFRSHFSFSPPFLFYFNFLNFFSFPFLLLSSSLLLLICSFFPSLCVLSAFVHHKTNPAWSFCPLSIFLHLSPSRPPGDPSSTPALGLSQMVSSLTVLFSLLFSDFPVLCAVCLTFFLSSFVSPSSLRSRHMA